MPHSDQGIQYAATAYTQVLHDAEVRIRMADKGAAWQNGYAECLIRTVKEEGVDMSEHLDYHDICQQVECFFDDVYIQKRIHSSLGYLIPAECEAQWQQEHTLVLDMELANARVVSSSWGLVHSPVTLLETTGCLITR